MKEKDILYQSGEYWVVEKQRKKSSGYQVIKLVANCHGEVCASIGYAGHGAGFWDGDDGKIYG